jgi:hypothetical protein
VPRRPSAFRTYPISSRPRENGSWGPEIGQTKRAKHPGRSVASGWRRCVPEWDEIVAGVLEDPELRFDGKAGDLLTMDFAA